MPVLQSVVYYVVYCCIGALKSLYAVLSSTKSKLYEKLFRLIRIEFFFIDQNNHFLSEIHGLGIQFCRVSDWITGALIEQICGLILSIMFVGRVLIALRGQAVITHVALGLLGLLGSKWGSELLLQVLLGPGSGHCWRDYLAWKSAWFSRRERCRIAHISGSGSR